MFKKLLLSFATFLFLFALAGSVQATTILPVPPDDSSSTGSKTHDQYYSVVFDGEGEAAVIAKLNVVNLTSLSMNAVNLDIPGKSLRLINTVQETQARSCARYSYDKYDIYKPSTTCEQYSTTYSANYYTLKPDVQKLKNVFSLTINLKQSIEPQSSTTIFLYYKVTGYVRSTLGMHNFNFETIKSNFDIDSVRVAVNVQEGFRIRGSSAKTNYAPNFTPLASEKSLQGSTDSNIQAFSSRISRETGFVKQTQSLDPGENFVVKGSYASSVWLLYLQDVINIIIVIVLAVLGVLAVLRWRGRKLNTSFTNIHPLVQVVGSSIVSSVTLIVVSYSGLWLISRLSTTGYGDTLDGLTVLLILLLLLIISVSLVLGPALYFGIKKSIKYGFMSAGSTIVILLLFTIILLIVLGSFERNPVIIDSLY